MLKQLLSRNLEVGKHNNDNSRGFSLLELIASTVMGLIILGFALGGFNSLKQNFVLDKEDSKVNQRLKTIFATMGPDMQQLGQGITGKSLPLVELKEEVVNGEKSSAITIRSVVVPRPLSINTSGGLKKDESSTTITIPTEIDSVTLGQWQKARLNNRGKIKASIFDNDGNRQEFDYIGEDFGKDFDADPKTITIANTTWAKDYPENREIYLISEKKYEVKEYDKIPYLILTVNNEPPIQLVEKVKKLNIVATIESRTNDGTTFISECKEILSGDPPTKCDPDETVKPLVNYRFQNIASIDVTATVEPQTSDNKVNSRYARLTEEEKKIREKRDLSLSQRFFPRNAI